MITADTFADIRTSPEINTPIYFYFEGDLFLDNHKEIQKISTFKGFNCARRQENNFITSYEYVTLGGYKNSQPIYNNEVNFTLFNVPTHLNNSNNRTTFSVPIPVNRDGYRALEHFSFSFNSYDYSDVTLAWTRYSEPRVEEEKALGYRWIYCGHGVKTFPAPKEEFPEFTDWR